MLRDYVFPPGSFWVFKNGVMVTTGILKVRLFLFLFIFFPAVESFSSLMDTEDAPRKAEARRVQRAVD